MSSITEKVIEYLRLYPNAKPSDIANYLGISTSIVRSILSRLKQKGIVVRTEKGYSLRHGLGGYGEPRGTSQRKDLEHSTIKQDYATGASIRTHTVESGTKSSTDVSTPAVLAGNIDDLRLSISDLNAKVLELEKKIIGIESSLSADQVHCYVNKELLELIVEVFEIIKMCLQAIAVSDLNSLNSLVGDLEELVDRLKHKL